MAGTITGATTVRDAIARYPGAEAIFDRHGLTGCGGPSGPTEPIGFFAAVHHVEPQALLRELNAYASSLAAAPVEDHAPATAGGTQLYPLFLTTSLILTLFVGVPAGIAAGMTGGGWGGLRGEAWIALVQAHGHLQVFGYLGLFIMGMAYHVLPRFKGQPPPNRRLVVASYALVCAGVLSRVLAQPHGQGWLRWLLGASALLELAGAGLFAAVIAAVFLQDCAHREAFDRFVLGGLAWLVAISAMNAYLVIDAARDGNRALNPAGDAALLEGAVFGFVVLFVLGVSFRALPFFLALRPSYGALRDASFLAIVAAGAARVAAVWAPEFGRQAWNAPVVNVSTFVLAAGIVGAVVALRVFEASDGEAPPGESPPAYSTMVRAAYAWLLVGVALDVYWQLRELDGGFTPTYAAGAVRHAMLLGFASLMLMAMAYRTVPVFSGRPLRWPRAVPVSFGLIAGAGVLRVFPVAFTTAPARLDFKLMTAGGFLLFGGLSVFAAEMFASMFGRHSAAAVAVEAEGARMAATPAEASTPGEGATVAGASMAGPIRRETTVAEALKLSPSVLQVLLDYGFGPLADPEMRARMAPTITIERAAAFVGTDPDGLASALNAIVASSRPSEGASVAPIETTLIDTTLSEPELLAALRSCNDPEIPVNIVDLGLVYTIVGRGDYVRIAMTLTSAECPMADQVEDDVRRAVMSVDGVNAVDVEIVSAPPWTPDRMSAAAREATGW